MRRGNRWIIGLIALLVVFTLAATACAGGGAQPAQQPAEEQPTEAKEEPAAPAEEEEAPAEEAGGTLVFGLSTDPPNLDPQINKGTAARTVKLQAYRGLVSYHKDGEISYELAESYEQEDDTTYLFHLRENANWHNGDPVTAADVKFSFERILDPAVGATMRTQLSIIDAVEAVDDKTVRITLKEPTASFIDLLAMPESAIVSKKFVEGGGDLDATMMGSGPFIFKEREKGVHIILEKNPDFYKPGLPKVDRLEFIPYRDENLRVTALKAGDVHIIEYVPWKDMPALETNPDITLETTLGPFMFLIFNPEREPFDDPQVRRALGYAIDRQAVLDAAFVGRGDLLFGLPIPKASWAYDEDAVDYWEYDPEKAKELLAEAGYPDGFETTLLSTATYDMHEQTAVVVKDSLSQIGVDVTLDLPEWGARVEQGNETDYDFAVMGTTADMLDPDYFTSFYCLEGVRYSRVPHWRNEETCRLLNEARATLDREKRKALYQEFYRIALEEAPYVWLTWRAQGYAYQNYLQGFQNMPGFLTFYSGVTLEDVSLAE